MENLFSQLLREDYQGGGLTEAELDPNPLRQFEHWLREAMTAGIPEPNAMILATVDGAGQPSARAVLLKGMDGRGFVFCSHYTSAKGAQIKENPRVALVFPWQALHRQVRIEGTAEKISRAESETYFNNRPFGARVSALVSHQSQVVASRRILEERYAEMERRLADGFVPLPKHWGGYRVVPELFEFWQGRPNRLHDRLRYRARDDGGWLVERLEP